MSSSSSLLSYLGTGECRERHLGLKIPPTNVQGNQLHAARTFASGLADSLAGAGAAPVAAVQVLPGRAPAPPVVLLTWNDRLGLTQIRRRPGVTAAATTAVFAIGAGPGVTALATTAVFATGAPMTPTRPTRAGLIGIFSLLPSQALGRLRSKR